MFNNIVEYLVRLFGVYSEIISSFGKFFMKGLWLTISMTAISIVFSVIIGVLVGYLSAIPVKKKNFKNRIIKFFQIIAKEYVDLIRGTPLMVQAIFFYFGFVPRIINPLFKIQMSAELAGIVIISLNAGAFLSEIFRGGIQAIDIGQMEAARSLGLSFRKSMFKIILPQAFKNMIPAILNQFITSLKDTSILIIIGVADLMGQGKIAYQKNYRVFETMLIIAAIYYVVIKLLSIQFKKIEEKLRV